MILLKEWIPYIPEEDKHIAYVGENGMQRREILLSCKDWKTYEKGFEFYLDIAFDLSSVTSEDQRQMVETQVGSTENISETVVKTNATTTETSYTVKDVQVDCASKTDVVHLAYRVEGGGVRLYWDISHEHTQLPGHLYCTLRAAHSDGRVKKSGVMVFEVDPAVVATPAAKITDNEFRQMERAMQTLLIEAREVAQDTTDAAQTVKEAADRLVVDEALDAASAHPVSNRTLTPVLEQLLAAKDDRDENVEENSRRIAALEQVAEEVGPRLEGLEQATEETEPRLTALEQTVEETEPRLSALEQVAEEVGPRLVALEERPEIVVDNQLNVHSNNPVENQAVSSMINRLSKDLYGEAFPRLMPKVSVEDTYCILRVAMNGTGFEFIPIQNDAYIQQWILPYLLPRVSSSDNGKTLQVVDGEWKLV